MVPDEITEEIRKIRHELAARFDNDIRRIGPDLRRQQDLGGRHVITLPRREPRQTAMKRLLTHTELVVVYHAIIFTLHTTFSRTEQPAFNEPDFQSLDSAAQRLNPFLRSNSTAAPARLEAIFDSANTSLLNNVICCVRAFDAEIGHSPDEVKIITNVPASVLKELLARLAD